jgi:enoyl-CoA hydratase/carnithine racemase
MAVARERRGHILLVSMQRQDKRNAIDGPMSEGIEQAVDELEDDADLWIGVLTGTPSVFSAGTDLKSGGSARTERGGEYGLIRRRRTKPLIAAVEGVALGGGFEVVLACDLAVAARTARFGLPEVRRGVVATSGAMFRLPRTLPIALAKEMLLTGEPIDADRAAALGLVNRVVDHGAALEAAVALAELVCTNSPVSVRATLQAVDRIVAGDDEAGWQATEDAKAMIAGSEDLQEGIAAFFERRPPIWKGR